MSDDAVPSVPTLHVLEAGVIAGSLIRSEGELRSVVHNSYVHVPTGGLFGRDDLLAGEARLVAAGLLKVDGDMILPAGDLSELLNLPPAERRRLLCWRLLAAAPPIWLDTAAGQGELAEELVPDDDLDNLRQLMSPEDREAFLLSLGRRVDTEALARFGSRGEEVVADACRGWLNTRNRPELANQVRRVSLISDQLGYDVVSPTLAGQGLRLEVKTTSTGPSTFEIILSRNEAEVCLRDDSWRLVVCRRDGDVYSVVGWTDRRAISSALPQDPPNRGRWTSVTIDIPYSDLMPDLPLAATC